MEGREAGAGRPDADGEGERSGTGGGRAARDAPDRKEPGAEAMTSYAPYLDRIDAQREHMARRVARWADINTGTGNTSGLDELLTLLREAFEALGGETEAIDLPPHHAVDPGGRPVPVPLGKALAVRKRPGAPLKVFLGCHADTVFPPDHPFRKSVREDDAVLRGPGVTDAKGGIAVMLAALEAFESSPFAGGVGWEALVNPDEEIGSPGSAKLFIRSAVGNDLGLVFEPPLPDGTLVGERKGSGTWTAVMRGRAAHAGRDTDRGRNAIEGLAELILDLRTLSGKGDGITVNTGHVAGGGPANIVPDLATCRFNVRVATREDRRLVEDRLRRLLETFNGREGFSLSLHGGFARPPKPLDAASEELLRHVAACGRELGLSLSWQPGGGSCDGNILVAQGLPTVDSLGPRGGGIHTPEEYLLVDSLPERARLTALFLMKLGNGEIRWWKRGAA
jgi:glutamate carboxypeptidase